MKGGRGREEEMRQGGGEEGRERKGGGNEKGMERKGGGNEKGMERKGEEEIRKKRLSQRKQWENSRWKLQSQIFITNSPQKQAQTRKIWPNIMYKKGF